MADTAIYDTAVENGNSHAKGATEGRTTTIRNVVVPYTGTDDELRSLGVFNLLSEDGAKTKTRQTDSLRYFFDDRELIAGEAAREVSVRTYSKVSYARFGSQEWLDMIAATFARLRKRSGELRLMFALPVAIFKNQRRDEKDRSQLEQIRDSLLRDWDICVGETWRQFRIIPDALKLVPEGMGIYYDFLLRADGLILADREAAKGFNAVWDFGDFNTSVLTFDGLKKGPYNESLTTGLMHVRAQLNRDLKARYGRADVPDEKLDKIIETGEYAHAGGKVEDVKDLVNNAMAPLINESLNLWNRDLAGGADVNNVFFGGGASAVIGDKVKPQFDHRNIRQVSKDRAAIAGAMGLLKLMKYQREYTKVKA